MQLSSEEERPKRAVTSGRDISMDSSSDRQPFLILFSLTCQYGSKHLFRETLRNEPFLPEVYIPNLRSLQILATSLTSIMYAHVGGQNFQAVLWWGGGNIWCGQFGSSPWHFNINLIEAGGRK